MLTIKKLVYIIIHLRIFSLFLRRRSRAFDDNTSDSLVVLLLPRCVLHHAGHGAHSSLNSSDVFFYVLESPRTA